MKIQTTVHDQKPKQKNEFKRIQVTLYDEKHKNKIARRVFRVPKKQWDAMNFLDQEGACKQAMESSLFWHWRELEKNET